MPRLARTCTLRCQHAVEAHYEWKVENFFSLSEEEVVEYYDSTDIEFAGSTFQLCLYPATADYIELDLALRKQSPSIKVGYTLGIKTSAGDAEVWASGTREFSPHREHFFCNYIEKSKLWKRRQELAPGDVLTITASLKTDDSGPDIGTTEIGVQTSVEDVGDQEANGGREALESTGTTEVAVQTSVEDAGDQEANGGRQALENTDFVTLAQSLKDLYAAGKDCDVTLEVKNKKFRAHRVILGARTPVLAAMFSHDTTEAETGIVRVEDCDPEAFEVFLRFVYSCTAENVTGENVANVYYVADKYDLPGLKRECVRHMLSNLTASTVCNAIALAERHSEELLQEKATEFFVDNAREIFRTDTWVKFMGENRNVAKDLIIRAFEGPKQD